MKNVIIHFKDDTGRVVDTAVHTLPDKDAQRLIEVCERAGDVVRVREARDGDLRRDRYRHFRCTGKWAA